MSTSNVEPESNNDYPKQLELAGVIGFNGGVKNGLILHPGDEHIIYPLGSTIVVRHLVTNTQTFLQKGGHDREVSCMALSRSGKYLATGQVSHMGFSAPVIIWDLETYEIVHKLTLHKGKIEDLAFSPEEKYLATLGGRDDNKLVVWDIASGEAICGSPASTETALCVEFLNNSDDVLVTGGNYNLRVWQFDLANRKIRPADCHLGQLKRVISSITIDEDDKFMVCGTLTGDVIEISLNHNLFKRSGPPKRPLPMGLHVVIKTKKGNYLIGSGDGTVACIMKDSFKVVRRAKFEGRITSLALNAKGDHFFVGTAQSNIYCVQLKTFDYELRNTCHHSGINDVAFPENFSGLFATCSKNDIRVWHAQTRNELLRIQVPNLECLCVAFSCDGKNIFSGWSDGKIRAFKPRSGKLMFAISDAHRDGVTAICGSKDCQSIISGGAGGMVRVWSIGGKTQIMTASMKEHKSAVNSVQVNNDDSECVSASSDGSCIVWDLKRFVRNTCLFASTKFKSIRYHPDQSQLLTTGTDRKITYWDVVDGNPIRILNGSNQNMINSLEISADGGKFVSAGGDKLVNVWGYDDGQLYYTGTGHSGDITCVKVSADQQLIVSVGQEGAVFLWRFPYIPEIDDELQAEYEAELQMREEVAIELREEEAKAHYEEEQKRILQRGGDGVLDMETGQLRATKQKQKTSKIGSKKKKPVKKKVGGWK